jgi:hypothetical protein
MCPACLDAYAFRGVSAIVVEVCATIIAPLSCASEQVTRHSVARREFRGCAQLQRRSNMPRRQRPRLFSSRAPCDPVALTETVSPN